METKRNSDLSRATQHRRHQHFKQDEEAEWDGPFFFVQGADTQFGMIESFNDPANSSWDEEIRLTRASIAKINQMRPKPKFFVICGDLCDALPDKKELRKAQEDDFRKVLSELDPDIPLVCVCGNHDIGNTPTVESIKAYQSSFGDDHFSFWAGGVFFIVINSQFYFDSSQVPELAREHDEWLEAQLKAGASSKHGPVIFQHIPWFLESPDNTTYDYFSIAHSTRMPMLEKLYKAGVRHVFAGHYHRNLLSNYKDMEMVVTSAIGGQLGNDKSGFRVVSVNEANITHKYYTIEDAPTNLTS